MNLSLLNLFLLIFQDRTAIQDATGEHTYRDLLVKAVRLSKIIQQAVGGAGTGQRIGFLCSGNVTYVVAKFAVWMSGNIGRSRSFTSP